MNAHQTADCTCHGPDMPFIRTPWNERETVERWFELTDTHGFRDETGALFMCQFCWMEWKYGARKT